MKGDFSRNTFDRRHRFSRVLMQQGRVLLDADWNEQSAILLHALRTLAADLIGPHGGPGRGFEIGCTDGEGQPLKCDFTIGHGHYYVDGILAENLPPVRCKPDDGDAPVTYLAQPDYPLGHRDKLEAGTDYLVYLDVWERHLTHLQAESIREPALGGPDTATRAKVVWQVKVASKAQCGCDPDEDLSCWAMLQAATRQGPRCLSARSRVSESADDPCLIPPEARYRGAENQLYRVEVHDPSGRLRNGSAGSEATFKWSRDNGSVVFAIRGIQGSVVALDSLGPDMRRSLVEGDWVEVLDDGHVLHGRPGVLAQVEAVDRVRFEVALAVPEDGELPKFRAGKYPLLRRWDQGSAAIPVREGKWIDLEDGVQVRFEPDGDYRTGDYWLVPARTATGDVLWPVAHDGIPQPLPPQGIEHHYAPLAHVLVADGGEVSCDHDCRCVFHPPCAPFIEEVVAPPAGRDALLVQFDATVRGADPLRYQWDFGDGFDADIDGGAAIEHRYEKPGNYRVRLTVTNDIGSDTLARWFQVGSGQETARTPPTPAQPRPTDRALMADLVRIGNVGDTRARVLMNAGRETPEAVAAMRVEEVRALLNVTETVAAGILESARKLVAERG